MENTIAFSLGRLVGKHKLLAGLTVGLLLAYMLWPVASESPPPAPPLKAAEVSQTAPATPAQEAPQKSDPAAEAASKKAELAKWKKEGVTIGMTAERALLSSWGKPEKINRTTNEFGVREQWVYGGGNYLYFKDGVLTSIQN